MPEDQRPKIAAEALGKVSLEKSSTKEGGGEALNRAQMLNSINKQGVIATPADHVPQDNNEELARGTMLNSINRQGVISMPSDHGPQKDESLARAGVLTAISKQGVKSASAPNENNDALIRASMLNSIARQGVIAVPAGHAPVTALSEEKVKELLALADQEKKENAEFRAALDAKKAELQGALAGLSNGADAVEVSSILPGSDNLVVVASTSGQAGQDASLEAVLAFNKGKTVTMDSDDSTQHIVPVVNSFGRVGAVVSVTIPKANKKACSIAESVRALLP